MENNRQTQNVPNLISIIIKWLCWFIIIIGCGVGISNYSLNENLSQLIITCLISFGSIVVIAPVSVFFISLTIRGCIRTPSFDIADIALINCIGVIVNLCPNDIVARLYSLILFSSKNTLPDSP